MSEDRRVRDAHDAVCACPFDGTDPDCIFMADPMNAALIVAAATDYDRLRAIEAAARAVIAEWDLLGPTGTSQTIGAHARLRSALSPLSPEKPA